MHTCMYLGNILQIVFLFQAVGQCLMLKAMQTETFAEASPHQALCEGTNLGDEMIHKSARI